MATIKSKKQQRLDLWIEIADAESMVEWYVSTEIPKLKEKLKSLNPSKREIEEHSDVDLD